MKRSKGLYRYRGYAAFKAACVAHERLFPGEKSIDGGSRRMAAIYAALDIAYTDGIKDAAQLDDGELRKIRKRISTMDRDV